MDNNRATFRKTLYVLILYTEELEKGNPVYVSHRTASVAREGKEDDNILFLFFKLNGETKQPKENLEVTQAMHVLSADGCPEPLRPLLQVASAFIL